MRWMVYILLLVTFALAKGEGVCTVDSIAWVGEHTDFDELQMNGALGQPCDAWKPLADRLVRYYEDEGFIAARDLQLEGFTGENTRHLSGSYKEPWILGTAWNVVLRGNFDEETLDESADGGNGDVADTSGAAQETVERVIVGEAGITRDIGFDFSIGVFFGISEDDKHTSFEMSYVSLDRFVLPRSGWRMDASATWKMARPDSLDNYLAAKANVILADARAMDALWGARSRIRHGNVWDAVDVRQMLKTGKGDIRRSGEALKKANKRLRQAAEAIAEAEDSARTAMRTYPADTGEEAELLIAARTEEPYGQSDWD